MSERACSVRADMTVHRFVAPFDRCFCREHAWPGEPPRTAPMGEMVSLTDSQFERLSYEQTLRNLEWIFSR